MIKLKGDKGSLTSCPGQNTTTFLTMRNWPQHISDSHIHNPPPSCPIHNDTI